MDLPNAGGLVAGGAALSVMGPTLRSTWVTIRSMVPPTGHLTSGWATKALACKDGSDLGLVSDVPTAGGCRWLDATPQHAP